MPSLDRGVARALGETLDAILDVPERLKAGLDFGCRNPLQDIGGDGVSQAVQIIDELTARLGQKQAVGPAVARIGPALQKSVIDQPIQQPDQRNWLQFKDFREIDLR